MLGYTDQQIKSFLGGMLFLYFIYIAFSIISLSTEVKTNSNNQNQIIGFLQAKPQPLNVK